MSRPLRSVPPTRARHPDLDPEEFIREILDRMARDDRRPVPYYRKSELCPPFSRGWIDARLDDGTLQAVKLRGLVLVTGESLRSLLASAEPWEPK